MSSLAGADQLSQRYDRRRRSSLTCIKCEDRDEKLKILTFEKPSLEQRQRLLRQHAAGQRDVGERRVGRDLGIGDHDLADLGGELGDRRAVDDAAMPHQTIAPMHIGHDSPEV